MVAVAPAFTQPLQYDTGPQNRRSSGTRDYNLSWGGYVVYVQSVTMASGSWTVPRINCSGVPTGTCQFVSEWIDGYHPNSPAIEQIGTESDCSGGTPFYYAWYVTPQNGDENRISGISLNAGDSMSVQVTSLGGGIFTLTMTDETTAQTFSTNISARWITILCRE